MESPRAVLAVGAAQGACRVACGAGVSAAAARDLVRWPDQGLRLVGRRFTDLIARGKTSIEELVELTELASRSHGVRSPLTQSQSPPKEPILLGFRLAARSRCAAIVNQQTAPIMPRGLDLAFMRLLFRGKHQSRAVLKDLTMTQPLETVRMLYNALGVGDAPSE